MRLSGTFILPKDIQLQSVNELSDQLRKSTGAGEGDFSLSRRQSRASSKIVDAATAELIRQFEKPSTIAQAVARFSRSAAAESTSPEQILEEALPLLRSLIDQGLLIEAQSSTASGTTESLTVGDTVGQWQVVRCVQSLEDTEVYLVRGPAGEWGALKIARPNNRGAGIALERESGLLETIAAANLPRLLDSGIWQERPYLVTQWIFATDAETAAIEIRQAGDESARPELIALGAAILDAYSCLNELGRLHGDVHPRNLLVDRTGDVTILDFGLASSLENSPVANRGGIAFFFEPEFALAALNDLPSPAASPAGEQYALAALLYLLLTGAHTQDFSVERRPMFSQIATGAMVSFAQRGVGTWPEIERVLSRALSKDPAERYSSIREFAHAWREAGSAVAPSASSAPRPDSKLIALHHLVIDKSAIRGEWMRDAFKTTPIAAVNYGQAGLAYALHRIACATDDGELHAVADAWSSRSVQALKTELAFEPPGARPETETPGLASLYHQLPGIYLAQALIAVARGDLATQLRAADNFISSSRSGLKEPSAKIDLTLGLAGNLLGAALLLDSFPARSLSKSQTEMRTRVLLIGEDLHSHLWSIFEGYEPIGNRCRVAKLTIAHGWAGILYASLCWQQAAKSSSALPDSLLTRLEQLAALAEPSGRGLRWPSTSRVQAPGWCNGSAGLVFLWTEAHQATGDSRFLSLAEGAAWNTWETPSRIHTLCCGLAGQSYALLNIHRRTGDAAWLRRATRMAAWGAEAASSAQSGDSPSETRPGSLYNGVAGVAVLKAELERPLEARMPLFERD